MQCPIGWWRGSWACLGTRSWCSSFKCSCARKRFKQRSTKHMSKSILFILLLQKNIWFDLLTGKSCSLHPVHCGLLHSWTHAKKKKTQPILNMIKFCQHTITEIYNLSYKTVPSGDLCKHQQLIRSSITCPFF